MRRRENPRPSMTLSLVPLADMLTNTVGILLFIEYTRRTGLFLMFSTVAGSLGISLANWHEEVEGTDTMQPLVAVLDTNFWLSTHVSIVTMGYCAGILAALVAHLYIFGKLFGGGAIIMAGRNVHIVSAVVFAVVALCMFLIWLKDMLPMPYDILWLVIMGGYLSKKKKAVPAGKFNAGQKMWFWLATVGGGVMAYTGWNLYTFQTTTDLLRIMAMIHNFLGATLLAMFLVHLYMVLFAISSALQSMITGSKPQEEVEIMHSRFRIPQ